MPTIRYSLVFFLFFLSLTPDKLFGQVASPLYFWDFNNNVIELDNVQSKSIDTQYYKCGYVVVDGKIGKAIDLNGTNCTVVTGALQRNVSNEFSIEFLFKGTDFTFLTFSQQSLIIRFNYDGFLFRTTTTTSAGKSQTDNFQVALKGAGKHAYNYYTDGNWHHLVFTANLKTGKKEIWVDGECPEGFSQNITTGKHFEFGTSDGFRNTDQIDELAFYDKVLSPELIRQHYAEVSKGKPYSFTLKNGVRSVSRKSTPLPPQLDPMEFAPGYPDYTIQATDQLRDFPLPRYNASFPVKRNMSWMDIGYLHRELLENGGKGFGKENPQNAVELTEEMAKNWNYYIDIPTLRTSADAATKYYDNPKSLHGAIINFANKNPQYPVSTILIEGQIRPVHAGFNSARAFVTAQDLPEKYYLKNENGGPVIQDKRKWLSPLMPLDILEKDGQTSRFYLNQLLKYLHRPPALINENGEVFGHIRKESLLKQDPAVWVHYKKSGLTESQYSGRFQYRMDSVYRAAVMKGFDPLNTHFSFYNLSAINPAYWPDYAMRRELNRWDKTTVYPTPDFYPRWPDNWQNGRGAYNGYGVIARGRLAEIASGDRSFTPFVSAGWGKEEDNIRPAQWLALLKAMMMLGADFFYTGYFNVTGAGGKWPNGVGPNDPRGYAYQIAMPAYAQAVRTWVPEFFEKGELLNPATPGNLTHQYRFKGRAENELILVRKLGKKYLIYGSIQPNSNIKGNVPLSKFTSIQLEGKTIPFEIRKQGSMYVLDLSGKDAVFFQLDRWHQYEHPYYWDKSVIHETELYTAKKGVVKTITEYGKSGARQEEFATYCEIDKSGELSYSMIVRADFSRLSICARSISGIQKVELYLGNKEKPVTLQINSRQWKDYSIKVNNAEERLFTIRMVAPGGGVQVDKMTFSEK